MITKTEKTKPQPVRTRFAPSPTGPIHMGNMRSALFNYLFAKREKGIFILRIEDTDKERSRPEWGKDILENLQWLGLQWNEGPIADAQIQNSKFKIQNYKGAYGPYRQSERTEIYKKYLSQLLEQGKAYYCFCKPEELEAQRQYQLSNGRAPKYVGTCRNLTKEQQAQHLKEGKPATIRFVVEPKIVTFHDLIRGEVKFDTNLIGDIVIARTLESPLYNFSVVVDDFEMKITHVIRGEDHIANTPKQTLLQEALGLPPVQYAHLPLLLGSDRTKLSKRHGDNSVTRFYKEGYLPEAVVNFLALLGWNPGDNREIFSLEELVEEFSLERIQKGGAVFNVQRLDWINGFYIRKKSLRDLTQLCISFFIKEGLVAPLSKDQEQLPYLLEQGRGVVQNDFVISQTKELIDVATLENIVGLYQERLKKISEITELTDFFFKKQLEYPAQLLSWKNAPEEKTLEALKKLEILFSQAREGEWQKEHLQATIMPEAEKETNRGYLLWPLRVALTGKQASAGPFEIAEVLGKEKTLQRIKEAQQKLLT